MPGRRWLALIAALLVSAWLGSATGAVRWPAAPGQWPIAHGPARARADDWARAVGGRVVQAHASPSNDDFAETLAVIEVDGPLWPDAELALDQALIRQAGPALGTDTAPDETEVIERGEAEPPLIRGAWELDGITYEVALASSGSTHALVVMAVQTPARGLYAPIFDEALATLEGVVEPVESFPHRNWRIGGFVGWVVAAIGAWALIAWRAEPTAGPLQRGRWVAAICSGLALVAGVIAYAALGGREAQLAVEGVSREWVAAEMSLFGLGAALVVMVVGIVLHGREGGPVQSAPTQGAFAERSTPPARFPVADPEGMARYAARSARPDHPDGRSELEEADAARRTPKAPEPSEGRTDAPVGFPPPEGGAPP